MEGIGTEIQERIKRKGLIISRIPEFAKESFIARAKFEFDDDYGMCLASMVKETNEYLILKQMFFNNELNIKLLIGENKLPNKEKVGEIRAANGKIIRKGGID